MPKPPPCPTEFDEQAAVVRWAAMCAEHGERRLELLHGDSSGVRLSIGAAVKAKRAGRKAGWPDLFLAVKTFDYSGLFVEMKRETGGVLSPEQKKLHARLREQGYAVVVCRGANEAINAIKDYLGM